KSDTSGFYFTIFEVQLADGSVREIPLSSQRFAEPGAVELLSDGSGILISAEAFGASFPQVWLLSRDGSARSLTNDLSDYRGLSLSADSSAFATIQSQPLAKMWYVQKGDASKAL